MQKVSAESLDIVKDNIEKLRNIFPDVFCEDKVDFDRLKEVLGEYREDKEERYSFTWNGKSKAIRLAQTPSLGTLRPVKEDSRNWDTTQNLYIEGDNLEALKLLQKSYYKKIKMIYIDPPYNTDNDFVYIDKFGKDKMDNEIDEGFRDENGNLIYSTGELKKNSKMSAKKHTNWLNMMYPRLKLARNLLKDDGVIFISIDDNEVHNLKKISDEVFGEYNFIARIVHKNNSMKNQSKFIGVTTEYILIYAKNLDFLRKSEIKWREKKKGAKDVNSLFHKLKNKGFKLEEIETEIKDLYSRPKYSHLSRWNKVDERGVFKDQDLSREGGSKDYTIINPLTKKSCVIPKRGWGKSYGQLLRLQKENMIWYGDESTPPGMKSYLTEDSESVPDNFIFADTARDKKLIDSLFGKRVFEFPKSIDIMKHLIYLSTDRDDIILDFFSGSASTAHANMYLNAEDGKNRRFIIIQLPEELNEKNKEHKVAFEFLKRNNKPTNISEIGKERIRRAGEKILEDNKDKEGIENLDIGFKVFRLDTSNIKTWNATFDNIIEQLEYSVNNIKEDRSQEDVLYEILLKYGLDLTLPVEEMKLADKTVYSFGYGALIICLDDDISLEVVEEIGKLKEIYDTEIMRVVFKDTGFKNDSVKTNSMQILKRYGIDDVKSI